MKIFERTIWLSMAFASIYMFIVIISGCGDVKYTGDCNNLRAGASCDKAIDSENQDNDQDNDTTDSNNPIDIDIDKSDNSSESVTNNED